VSIADRIKNLVIAETRSPKKKNAKSSPRAKIIAICSQKGGVGKTTTAVNLGSALAKFHNKKVLVTDLDPQGHVEKSLGSTVNEGVDYTPLSRVLIDKKSELLDAVVKTNNERLHITPGDKTLYETEGALTAKIGREFILTNSLDSARSQYDFIIIDCPPNLGNLTLNALCAADYVLVPCEMSVLAFEGVSDLLSTLDTVTERLNPELKVLGVLFTRVDGRNITMNKLVEDNMTKQFKGQIFRSKIAVNTDLNKAQLEGCSVFDFAPSSSGSSNYKDLSSEILKRLAHKPASRAAAKRTSARH
jgi:chromosome partitioning protein